VDRSVRDDAQLVAAARTDEPEAFGPLAQRWFDRCWDLAWGVLRDRELAADVAQDALLTAWQQLDRLERPESFGGWLLRITRNRALDVLRREVRAVPTDDATRLEPGEDVTPIGDPVADHQRAHEHELVWAAAAALGPRDASILDLHLRHGLEPHELADELGIAPNAAHQALFRLRKRLAGAIRAWLLWRGGEPTCVVLRAELTAAGKERFGPEVVRAVDRHTATCGVCEEERERVVAPASLFSVVPFGVAPLAMRQVRFERLLDAGVPVGAVVAEPGPGPGAGSGPGPGAGPGAGPGGRTGDGLVDGPGGGTGAAPDGVPGVPPGDGHDRRLAALAGTAIAAVVLLLGGWLLWGGAGSSVPAEPVAEPVVAGDPPPLAGSLPGDATVADPPAGLLDAEPAEEVDDAAEAELVDPPPAAPAPEPDGTPDAAPPGPSTPGPTGEPDPERPDGEGDPDDPDPDPDPAPVITSLTVVVAGACDDGTLQHRVTWETEHAEEATLQAGDAEPAAVAPTGGASVCAPRGSEFTLTATGPGGTATQAVRAG
jgi:RNA polymerase sigma factor (sigma-70 family)